MLHISLLLIEFLMKRRFSNIVPDPLCTDGGSTGWTSPQVLTSERGAAMVATEADAVARDLRLSTADQIAWSSKVVLDVVVNGCCAQLETRKVDYFLWNLFGAQFPFVADLTSLITWYETNQVTFDGRVKNSHYATEFLADVSWVLG